MTRVHFVMLWGGSKMPLATMVSSCFRSSTKLHREGHGASGNQPLIVMKDGRLRVLDAKMSFDGNALFRHDDIMTLRDLTEEDGKEIEASKYDLAYVALEATSVAW